VTANIAYRRDALARLGGFCERFPRAHCEDMDLALRALELGPIGFAPEMRVVHWPRAMTLRDFLRHARIVGSELVLMERHPERFRRTLVPRRVVPVLGIARHWARVLRRDRRNLRSPLRLGRLVAVALAQIVVASVVVARAEVAE
jgi:GT2 family glycosyltransferase